jgi:transcriptional regulator with XRE-family HTH domain
MNKQNTNKLQDHHIEQLKEIGALILEYRRSTGLSRKEFATKNQLNPMTLYRIESGKYDYKLSTLMDILDAHFLILPELF